VREQGVLSNGSWAQSKVQLIRQVCGYEPGPRSSWEINSLVRVRIRIRSGSHDQGQTQLVMTRQVHSDKAGPRSSQQVTLQLRVPVGGVYGQGQAWLWLSWRPT